MGQGGGALSYVIHSINRCWCSVVICELLYCANHCWCIVIICECFVIVVQVDAASKEKQTKIKKSEILRWVLQNKVSTVSHSAMSHLYWEYKFSWAHVNGKRRQLVEQHWSFSVLNVLTLHHDNSSSTALTEPSLPQWTNYACTSQPETILPVPINTIKSLGKKPPNLYIMHWTSDSSTQLARER